MHECGCRLHTAAQAQDFDVVAILRTRQTKQGRCEEHGLIVWVGNEQQYALVAECGERRAQRACVHPEPKEDEGHKGPAEPVHVGGLLR